ERVPDPVETVGIAYIAPSCAGHVIAAVERRACVGRLDIGHDRPQPAVVFGELAGCCASVTVAGIVRAAVTQSDRVTEFVHDHVVRITAPALERPDSCRIEDRPREAIAGVEPNRYLPGD